MKLIVIIAVILGGIYFSLFSSASKGYGYTGYSGYSSGPSFFYFGGPSIYPRNTSSGSIRSSGGGVRNSSRSSVSSSRFRGGGPSSGK